MFKNLVHFVPERCPLKLGLVRFTSSLETLLTLLGQSLLWYGMMNPHLVNLWHMEKISLQTTITYVISLQTTITYVINLQTGISLQHMDKTRITT